MVEVVRSCLNCAYAEPLKKKDEMKLIEAKNIKINIQLFKMPRHAFHYFKHRLQVPSHLNRLVCAPVTGPLKRFEWLKVSCWKLRTAQSLRLNLSIL